MEPVGDDIYIQVYKPGKALFKLFVTVVLRNVIVYHKKYLLVKPQT